MSWRGNDAAIGVLSFDIDAESAILAQGGHFLQNASVMTHQAFGPRVGVPRILALLEEYDLPATFFIPGVTAERYPAMMESIIESGHEIGHHSHTHRSATTFSASDERADFERALAALAKYGVTPVGHRAALWEASWRTPELVAEYGFLYDTSLQDADRPYRLDTASGSIMELPGHWSLDDWEQYAYLPDPNIGQILASPSKVVDMWTREIDAMRRHNSLFLLTCHPFISGRASRIEGLREVIEYGLEAADFRFLSARQVAELANEDEEIEVRRLEIPQIDLSLY